MEDENGKLCHDLWLILDPKSKRKYNEKGKKLGIRGYDCYIKTCKARLR